jgi:hypothetical protein
VRPRKRIPIKQRRKRRTRKVNVCENAIRNEENAKRKRPKPQMTTQQTAGISAVDSVVAVVVVECTAIEWMIAAAVGVAVAVITMNERTGSATIAIDPGTAEMTAGAVET